MPWLGQRNNIAMAVTGWTAVQRVLVADDDPEIRALLESVLTDEGYLVQVASDGQAALEQVNSAHPDLLIIDLLMPRLTGWSVFTRVRALAPRLPILVISGTEMGERQQAALRRDRAAYLQKPVSVVDMLSVVSQLLEDSEELSSLSG